MYEFLLAPDIIFYDIDIDYVVEFRKSIEDLIYFILAIVPNNKQIQCKLITV